MNVYDYWLPHQMSKNITSANDLYGMALKELSDKDYQGAIESFKKSLALHDDWQSYQGLGKALGS